jgi:hypothetical protein
MQQNKIDNVIVENQKRLERINKEYNPLVGTAYCEDMKRTKLFLKDAPVPLQYIPIEMESEDLVKLLRSCGTLSKVG